MTYSNSLITGGAGFIGCNLAHRLLQQGQNVTIYDNLSRQGAQANLAWLYSRHGNGFHFVNGDLRDYSGLLNVTRGVDTIYHLAGQVAVTTSVTDPRCDFEANVLGTFNLLEAVRQSDSNPIFLYSSTNKVYGRLDETNIVEDATRYVCPQLPHGVAETQPLDFHSPYACSKGAGDQYVRDYARTYGLRTVVFRQSCIFGQRQLGSEEQGWVAWFVIAALLGRPITIYGNGKQVRDLLFIEDLLDAYDAAVKHIDLAQGQIYNIGGGPRHSLSIWAEFGPLLSTLFGREIAVTYKPCRLGDQPLYISDIRKAQRDLGWQPKVTVEEGIIRLYRWVVAHTDLFHENSLSLNLLSPSRVRLNHLR